MKRKEREHLKEDPFREFIQTVLDYIKQFRKYLYIGGALIAALVIILVVMNFLKYHSIKAENQLYSEALSIKSDTVLTIDQKIDKMSQLDTKSGISASVKLLLAALLYEKGDYDKSQTVLDEFSGSNITLINNQKTMLEADILVAAGKHAEALEKLNQLLSDEKSEVGKDFVLLKMARIQSRAGQTETAIANLDKIMEDYPTSAYSYEARNLKTELEQNK